MSKPVNVAVGVVINQQQQVLIALRQSMQHQGNLWEFPGGKVESEETVEEALARELQEEVGICVHSCIHLLDIHHNYADKQVLLKVWKITNFTGLACGNEGQEIRWVALSALKQYTFPDANNEIVTILQKM